MIAAEDDNGVIIQPAALEHVQQLADAVVDIADGAVVGAAGAADLFVAKLLIPQITNLEQPLRVRILFFLGNPDLGQLNLYPLVQIPVLLLDGVRVVRVREGDLVVVVVISIFPHIVDIVDRIQNRQQLTVKQNGLLPSPSLT